MIKFSINEPEEGKKYQKRVGAYAVVRDDRKLIAVVKTDTGYFLPGGGVDNDETLEECLLRECIEEIGATINVLEYFAQGSYYFYSTTMNVDMESVGHFFLCTVDSILNVGTEPNHELVWLDANQAIEKLYLDNQKEAVRIFESQYVA
jgi:8-oxo-dGTP diphosphatase